MTAPGIPPPEPSGKTLVIGYGSTLRGDDGVGPAVAERIEALRLDGVECIACHQLTPELADPIARARTVIFVDAAIDLPDDRVRLSPIHPQAQHQVMVHTASPGGLLHLAESVFGRRPQAWLVAIPIARTGIGESFSPLASRAMGQAEACILTLLGQRTDGSGNKNPVN